MNNLRPDPKSLASNKSGKMVSDFVCDPGNILKNALKSLSGPLKHRNTRVTDATHADEGQSSSFFSAIESPQCVDRQRAKDL